MSYRAGRGALCRRARRSTRRLGRSIAPNITPDKTNGIGAWSDDEFYRAMHEGIGKHGEYLYPAFPYQWFTKVTREDVDAIRAYLQTVPPSSAPSKPTRLMFPFNIREGIGAWNDLYFKPGAFAPDASKSDEWNRGAYLVEGLGHCGDCHTPKGIAMQPETSKAFSGGAIDDWYAPNITSDVRSAASDAGPRRISCNILKTGAAPGKGVLVGPMAQVVHDSLSHLTDEDLHAIAAYLKTIPPISDYKARAADRRDRAARLGRERLSRPLRRVPSGQRTGHQGRRSRARGQRSRARQGPRGRHPRDPGRPSGDGNLCADAGDGRRHDGPGNCGRHRLRSQRLVQCGAGDRPDRPRRRHPRQDSQHALRPGRDRGAERSLQDQRIRSLNSDD